MTHHRHASTTPATCRPPATTPRAGAGRRDGPERFPAADDHPAHHPGSVQPGRQHPDGRPDGAVQPGRRHRRDEPEPARHRRLAGRQPPLRRGELDRPLDAGRIRSRDAAARRHLCRRVHAARRRRAASPSASVDQNGAVVHTEQLGRARGRRRSPSPGTARTRPANVAASGPLRVVVTAAGGQSGNPTTATWTDDRRHPVAGRGRRKPPRHRPRPARARAPPSASPEPQSPRSLPMSFYTSLSGLRGAQTDLSTISNNIANVGSIGFKRSRAQFGDIMPASATTAGQGTRLQAASSSSSRRAASKPRPATSTSRSAAAASS